MQECVPGWGRSTPGVLLGAPLAGGTTVEGARGARSKDGRRRLVLFLLLIMFVLAMAVVLVASRIIQPFLCLDSTLLAGTSQVTHSPMLLSRCHSWNCSRPEFCIFT